MRRVLIIKRVLIVGKPGSGKSTKMIEIARNLNPVLMMDEVVNCRRLERLIDETEDFEISVVAVTTLPIDFIPENILQKFEIIDLDEENDLILKDVLFEIMRPLIKKLQAMSAEDHINAVKELTDFMCRKK